MSNSGPIPSDALDDVLAVGRSHVTTGFVSLGAREPDGRDAAYLEWHALDHRPELHRIGALRTGLRVVSTPACRAARAASAERFDAVDHVLLYLFADGWSEPFAALGAALAAGGRMPLRLPSVAAGAFGLAGACAAPRILAGADVLPWRPSRGAYLLLEHGADSPAALVDTPGVAGAWWFTGTGDLAGLQLTWCFLDEDPVAAAGRIGDAVAGRSDELLLAAPFHTVVPFAWDRHLP